MDVFGGAFRPAAAELALTAGTMACPAVSRTLEIRSMQSPPLTGDQRFVKAINRMALLRLLRDEPGGSRAALSELSGLTKSTVSLLVKELIDEGWLSEDN